MGSIPLDAVDDPHLVYLDKFGRPQREAEATYLSPFPDGWWHDDAKPLAWGIVR